MEPSGIRSKEETDKIKKLARQVMDYARDDLLVHLRFLDTALGRLTCVERFGLDGIAVDGRELYYDPVYVLKLYRENPKLLTRTYLHSLFHCVFSHAFGYDKLEQELWDLAVDMAVEAVVLELDLGSIALDGDAEARQTFEGLKREVSGFTADKLYRYFKGTQPGPNRRRELRRIFKRDLHDYWKPVENYEITEEQWQQISRRIRAEINAFSQKKGQGESLEQNLSEAGREHYDYGAILRRFMVLGENITVNEDEFDYVYYTYGLRTYGNLPLVEPLEYKEEKKVREFVIALDTSASCRAKLISGFFKKTRNLLMQGENFFRKVNIHIIQCDSEVQSDVVVRDVAEFEEYLKGHPVNGFGATDFRPVFDYVNRLQRQGEFENLKGLIYFTDGYGIYPDKMPPYEVVFAFLNEDPNRGATPPWAMKAVLEEEELERAADEKETETAE